MLKSIEFNLITTAAWQHSIFFVVVALAEDEATAAFICFFSSLIYNSASYLIIKS